MTKQTISKWNDGSELKRQVGHSKKKEKKSNPFHLVEETAAAILFSLMLTESNNWHL